MINFEATLKALSDRGVNFVVIGGYAATLHDSAYLTRDLDLLRLRHSRLASSSGKVPKKAMSLLNVSTCMPKPAAALSVALWP